MAAESDGLDSLWVSAELEAELAGLSADALARLLGETRDRLIRLPDGRAYQRKGLEELLEELRALKELGIRPGFGGALTREDLAFLIGGDWGACAASGASIIFYSRLLPPPRSPSVTLPAPAGPREGAAYPA